MAAYKAIISFLELNQFQMMTVALLHNIGIQQDIIIDINIFYEMWLFDDFFNKEQTWKIFLDIWWKQTHDVK